MTINDDVQDLLRFHDVEALPGDGEVLSSVTEEESSDTVEADCPDCPDSQHKVDEETESSVSVITPLLPLLPGPDMPPSYSRLISLSPGLLAVSPPPYQDAIKVDTLEQILTAARETQLL